MKNPLLRMNLNMHKCHPIYIYFRKTRLVHIAGITLLWLLVETVSAETNHHVLAYSCVACHGINGVSRGPATPSIAGLSRNYIIGAMLSYKYAQDLDHGQAIVDENDDLEDVAIRARPATMMSQVAQGYSLSQMKAVADFYSRQPIVRITQNAKADRAKNGKKLHKKYCDKCHEEGGRSTEDDVGLLAGQWATYLRDTLQDFNNEDREMAKKMKKKMQKMLKKHGDESLEDLIQFYISQQ